MVFISRNRFKIIRNVWHLSLIITSCSACVFGASSKNLQHKRSHSTWFTERVDHKGLGLSDQDLQKVSEMGNEKHFNDVLSSILIPRVVDTPGHTKVREYIIREMGNLGWTVETHSFEDKTPVGTKTFANVIATLNPSATRRLVIACHYDSKLTPEGFLGATDSAVPCSMMINLAHILQGPLSNHSQERQDLTLQLIFIDGEEAFERWSDTDSLYGARKLAHKLHTTQFPPGGAQQTTELHRIDLFVLLDLIGTEDCRFFSYFEDSESWYARLSSFEKRMMNQGLINKRVPMFREQSYYGARIEDDHIPFLRKGVPVLHLIAAPFPSVWHKMSDNRSSLHPPSIENMNALMRAFVIDYLHLSI